MAVRVVISLVALSVALVAACSDTGSTEPPAGTPSAAPPVSATPTSTRPPTSSPSNERADQTTEPLVLAIHPTRAAQDIDLATANRIAQGSLKTWRGFRVVSSLREAERSPTTLAILPASTVGPSVRPITIAGVDPFKDPARYPLRTNGPQPPAQVIDLTIGGDVMLGRRVATAAARTGDVSRPLRAIGPRLAAADLTVVNLESTLARAGTPQQGNDSFAAPPGVLAGLRAAGVDVLSLANNHTGDFQQRALIETVRLVRQSGIQPVGAGSNLQEAARPVVVTRGGVRFGFLAFNAIGETPRATATSPGALSLRMPPRTGPLNQGDLAAITRSIRTLKASADVVVVIPHWGQQYTHNPVPAQDTVATALTQAGADLVIGGHPHWVQSVRFPAGKVVAHSLGNLVFDMDFAQQTQEGVLLELTYWGKTLKAARLTPYVIGADFSPRIVTGTRAEQILTDIRTAG
ncbi:poly-gamma-glutamate synthesis protein (capsule biosynthesis protein) [Kribbella sp. VKM Ac-2527]|uniref:Poly-gamma-glutamate synthesis protein (Capsule biosynthesis protein) n=1 Tax=Kribbella caucasensis TaxID=2512215 RepID=A0A4R6KB43_9ACTN|nr:CapA family protein [Kribbella sp. VKM Ac-2527]TDO45423.1 poly-gamma-glutamate synthesis protein (capsule biosynthesis protein) [Kribbella sp. VKM Ac-2527]